MGTLVGEEGIDALELRAVRDESAFRIEVTTLRAYVKNLRQAFFSSNVNDTDAGKVPVFDVKWTVQNIQVVDQFRREALQRAQIPLPVPLGTLILLNVVHQDFQAAVDATVV